MLVQQDFRSLCDIHYTKMAAMTVSYLLPGKPSECEITDAGCTQPGCTRHYDPAVGYYDLTNSGRLEGKFDSPYMCQDHQIKLYLKSYNPQTKTQVWECPERGCATNQTVRVAA